MEGHLFNEPCEFVKDYARSTECLNELQHIDPTAKTVGKGPGGSTDSPTNIKHMTPPINRGQADQLQRRSVAASVELIERGECIDCQCVRVQACCMYRVKYGCSEIGVTIVCIHGLLIVGR